MLKLPTFGLMQSPLVIYHLQWPLNVNLWPGRYNAYVVFLVLVELFTQQDKLRASGKQMKGKQ